MQALVALNQPGHPNIPEIYDYFSSKSGKRQPQVMAEAAPPPLEPSDTPPSNSGEPRYLCQTQNSGLR